MKSSSSLSSDIDEVLSLSIFTALAAFIFRSPLVLRLSAWHSRHLFHDAGPLKTWLQSMQCFLSLSLTTCWTCLASVFCLVSIFSICSTDSLRKSFFASLKSFSCSTISINPFDHSFTLGVTTLFESWAEARKSMTCCSRYWTPRFESNLTA